MTAILLSVIFSIIIFISIYIVRERDKMLDEKPTPSFEDVLIPQKKVLPELIHYYKVEKYLCVNKKCQLVDTLVIANQAGILKHDKFYKDKSTRFTFKILHQTLPTVRAIKTNLKGRGSKVCERYCKLK